MADADDIDDNILMHMAWGRGGQMGGVRGAVGGTHPIFGKLEIFLVYIRNR
jgi:hypothetical protein